MGWPGVPLRVPPLRLGPPREFDSADDARAWLRGRALIETWLVLGVSLGASAVWSALSLVRSWAESLASGTSLSKQTSALNTSLTPIVWLDAVYQLTSIVLALVPVALVVYLLARDIRRPLQHMGIDRSRQVPDAVLGVVLAAVIGLPGLALYLSARAAGINTTVEASGLGDGWWNILILCLSAVQNAVLEEIVMIGYLFTRWSQIGWGRTRVIVTSALIRGAYHLYQGLGGFVGNLLMGLIFGWLYTRTRRMLPLIVAHTILDVVSFVGYALLHGKVSWL